MSNIVMVEDMPDSGIALGCDVSYCQDPRVVQWGSDAADREGIGWAMIRTSYGAGSDSKCKAHWENAREARLAVGGYHFVTEAPADQQAATLLGMLSAVGCGPGDIAPALDCEWLPDPTHKGGRLPHDFASYRATVDHLIAVLTREYGGCWLYTCSGFWGAVGGPASWKALQWWVPYYPRPGFSEADARIGVWPPSRGVGPGPAAWQYGCPPAEWDGGGPVDRNIARRLPFIYDSESQ